MENRKWVRNRGPESGFQAPVTQQVKRSPSAEAQSERQRAGRAQTGDHKSSSDAAECPGRNTEFEIISHTTLGDTGRVMTIPQAGCLVLVTGQCWPRRV